MRILLFLISLILHSSLFAKVINYQTASFTEIAALYNEANIDPKTTLLVFDLDDTLLTMTQPLGSVGWWDWQYKLQKMKEAPDKLFTADYQQLVRIQNILFQLIKMRVTDDAVLPFLKNATSQGSIIIGLTARGKEHLSATMLQLKDNDFTIGDKPLFQEKGLKFKNNKTSVAGNVHCPQFTHEVIYQQGVMFLDGEDKGQALLCVLSKTKKEIKTILFVDDAIKNIVSVNKAFSDSKGLRVLNIHFTKENVKQMEIQQNLSLQTQLFEQWYQIKKNLDDVIINSNF